MNGFDTSHMVIGWQNNIVTTLVAAWKWKFILESIFRPIPVAPSKPLDIIGKRHHHGAGC